MFNTQTQYQTLSQFLTEIKEFFQDWAEYRWIVAEIARVDSDKNGHYWFELVEKSNGDIVAQTGAVLWRGNVDTIHNFYLKTGINLQRGLKILFLGKAIFHEKYGFKINIFQIDPSYTLGEMAIRKKEVLERLEKEGLLEKNKAFEIPIVIQKIAIISSESAAGYEDFLKILKDNKYGFKFYIKLYDSFVQGQEAVTSIVNALNHCALEYEKYDVIVIIRGGGSVVDLQCFDEYEIAKKIAMMPLPVLTGIGHTRDKTVADHVAHSSFKTPSEVAKFILEKALSFDSQIESLKKLIANKVKSIINIEISKNNNYAKNITISVNGLLNKLKSRMNSLLTDTGKVVLTRFNAEKEQLFRVKHLFHKNTNLRLKNEIIKINSVNNRTVLKLSQFLTKSKFNLKRNHQSIMEKTKNFMNIKTIELRQMEDKLRLLSPENILKRGYSITYFDGKPLKNAKDVHIGDNIEIYLFKGKIWGKVRKKEEGNGKLNLF